MMPDFFFTYHPFRAELVKQASGAQPPIEANARAEVDGIMQQIYAENPSFWPYGLSSDMLDGGAYLVRDALTKQAFGFAGWQEREENGRRIGYYAIGILPEYRGVGLAKKAVAQLIREKSANVDEVRAFIVPGNKPSIALANSLGVRVMHKAASVLREFVGPALGGGLANAALWDSVNRHAAPFTGDWDAHRVSETLINGALFGAPAGVLGVKGFRELGQSQYAPAMITGAAGSMGLTPAKDLLMRGNQLAGDAQKALQRAGAPKSDGLSKRDLMLGGATAAGLGGLGFLLYRGLKGLRQPQNTGTVTIKLPRPDGTFTEVQMPMEQLVDLPDNVVDALGRDVKRRLREESRLRTFKRDRSGRLRPLVLDAELVEKPASVAPPPAAPMPAVSAQVSGRAKPLGPATPFSNYAQQLREQHDQRIAAEDQNKAMQQQQQLQQQQIQQQQQHEMAQTKMQVDAKAQSSSAPAGPAPGTQISPATSYLAKSVMKSIGRLKVASPVEAPKPVAPKPAAAPAAAAPVAAPAIDAKYAPEQKRLETAGYKVQQTPNGIVGVNNAGNRVFVDQFGRRKFYQQAVPTEASAYTWDSLRDWAHGRPGATAVTADGVSGDGRGFMGAVNADLGGWNPLKHIAGWGENTLRAGARTTMGMMDMGDAVRDGDAGALLDATKRTAGAYGNVAGRIGGALLLGGPGLSGVTGARGLIMPGSPILGGALRYGAGSGVVGALGASGAWDEERPYEISGSQDPRLAAALGEKTNTGVPKLFSEEIADRLGNSDYNATMHNMGYGTLPSLRGMGADNRAPFGDAGGFAGLITQILGGVAQNYAFGNANQEALLR